MDAQTIRQIFKIPDFTPEEWAARDAEIAEAEKADAERAKLKLYRETVPERYWTESIYTFSTTTSEDKKNAEAVECFIREVRCGEFRTLIMLGNYGTGKTHLACSAIRECGGLYRTSSSIVDELKQARSFQTRDTEAELLRRYANPQLLVIDEIGRGSSAQDEQYMLYHVINERYNSRKATILVSNHEKREFLNYIGTATVDRLTESASTLIFTGESWRAKKRG